ncbi:MAG: DciA family protein [Vulcanimicrobiaceae bacterium]
MLKPIRQTLETWTPHEGAAAPASDPLALLGARWEDFVGPENARHSHPSQVIGAVLVVTTSSGTWSQQLGFLAPKVVEEIAKRLPRAGIERLRFRVGRLPAPLTPGARTAGAARMRLGTAPAARPPVHSAQEAVERFRADVDAEQRAKRTAGWKECSQCGVQVPPGRARLCVPCRSERTQSRAAALAQILYQTPGIDFADAAAQVKGLSRQAFESQKRRLLGRWRTELDRVARDGRLSRGGRERSIASSYVLLKTGIPPEHIAPATIRNELGDVVYDLIYGTEP